MFQTFSYDDPAILPAATRARWKFIETNSAAAVMKAVCPKEWAEIVNVLTSYSIDPKSWLRPGGNRGDIPEQIDELFAQNGWQETRLDMETRGILLNRDGVQVGQLPPNYQEGYLVDNFKNRIVVDVEWNAKDGNLDRDLAAYRSWYEAGLISAGVIITKDRLPLFRLAKRLWNDYQLTLPAAQRNPRLPIDLKTSTTTTFDKAELRMRRGVMGGCPVLVIAASDTTWNGQPFTP